MSLPTTEATIVHEGNASDSKPWTDEEDALVLRLVAEHGPSWTRIASHFPGRSDSSVRNRHSRLKAGPPAEEKPPRDRGAELPWTKEEEEKLHMGVAMYGARWSTITRTLFPGRTINAVRNRFNRQLRKPSNAGDACGMPGMPGVAGMPAPGSFAPGQCGAPSAPGMPIMPVAMAMPMPYQAQQGNSASYAQGPYPGYQHGPCSSYPPASHTGYPPPGYPSYPPAGYAAPSSYPTHAYPPQGYAPPPPGGARPGGAQPMGMPPMPSYSPAAHPPPGFSHPPPAYRSAPNSQATAGTTVNAAMNAPATANAPPDRMNREMAKTMGASAGAGAEVGAFSDSGEAFDAVARSSARGIDSMPSGFILGQKGPTPGASELKDLPADAILDALHQLTALDDRLNSSFDRLSVSGGSHNGSMDSFSALKLSAGDLPSGLSIGGLSNSDQPNVSTSDDGGSSSKRHPFWKSLLNSSGDDSFSGFARDLLSDSSSGDPNARSRSWLKAPVGIN